MNYRKVDDDFIYLRGLRLRGGIGGGLNPFITEEFLSIMRNFAAGEFEYEFEDAPKRKDRINSNSNVEVSRNPDKNTRLSVVGIQDDDREPSFIDIFVLKNGDTKLRIRNPKSFRNSRALEYSEVTGEMLFKTAENGGKNPVIATTLTRLAERIAKAKRSV